MTTNRVRGKTTQIRLHDAERLLVVASKEGSYRKFENALAAFDRAIADDSDERAVREARKQKVQAVLAYARQALANRDYELAESLVEPLNGCGREADLMKRLIKDRIFAARLRNRNMNLMIPGLLALGAVILVAIINLYYYLRDLREENPHLANLVHSVDKAINASANTSLQYYILSLHNHIKASGQEQQLSAYKNYDDFKFFIQTAAVRMEAVQGMQGEKRDELHRYLADNLDVIADFRHDLASEPERHIRRRNATLIKMLDDTTQVLLSVESGTVNWAANDNPGLEELIQDPLQAKRGNITE